MSRTFLVASCILVFAAGAYAQKPGEKPEAPPPAPPAPPAESPYREEVEGIAKATKLDLTMTESDSFVFVWGIPRGQTQPIVDACERGLKIFIDAVGMSGWQDLWGPKKALVIILSSRIQYGKILEWYAGLPNAWKGISTEGAKVTYWPSPTPRVCTMMHLKPTSITGIVNTAVHEVGHLCMLRYKFHNNFVPPWLEEGFACWLEAKTTGKNNCYCFAGGYGDQASRVDKLSEIEWTKWKQTVGGMARQKSDKALREIVPLSMTQLSAAEIAKAWSIVDWMMAEDPKKFAQFLTIMKREWPRAITFEHSEEKGRAQETALKESYGVDFAGLDTKWRVWAGKTYPKAP